MIGDSAGALCVVGVGTKCDAGKAFAEVLRLIRFVLVVGDECELLDGLGVGVATPFDIVDDVFVAEIK